ncbi:hypothetical protein ACFYQ5_31440 [Streptomyces sp. NPDC005794]|uniref:hypothetical protein n=1 Tax=Streptomyces sp. NPDC005794 TaxID=3364733 RepID=UPI0036823BDA
MLRRQRVDVLDVAPLKWPVAFVGIMSAISVLAMLMMVALVTGAIEDLSRFGPTLIDLGGAAADSLGWGWGSTPPCCSVSMRGSSPRSTRGLLGKRARRVVLSRCTAC